ncbi:STM3941 family protein [Hymenobacter nivis]|uniref:PH domain-containing protein n=1 Tax=Hymenobacter nivis TaxID=1850093 RepID=A0A502GZU0_9BACT|nr:STM3941 family protein [Hymenobacter nivis]TPG66660.1 hypothetical protein EAH73_09735 [Hymenobacter nivis]
MAEDLIYYNSRWRYALLTGGSLAFVAVGGWMVVSEGNWGGGLASVFFFGACAAIGAWQFFDSRPRLQISDAGITDRTLGVGTIRWHDIAGAYVRSVNREFFICLHLRNEAAYVGRLSPLKQKLKAANQALGFTPIAINLSGVAIDPEQLLEYILKQAAATQLVRPDFPLN